MSRVQGVKECDSYFHGWIGKSRVTIPSFEEACRLQIANPKLFDTHIHTRTYAVFGPNNKFKIDDLVVPLVLRTRPIVSNNFKLIDGFVSLSKDLYDIIESKEYVLGDIDPSGSRMPFPVRDIRGDLLTASRSEILQRLVGNTLDSYLDAKFSGQKPVFEDHGFDLVYIQRLNTSLEFYASPFRVGTKEYYIAVGEDRFTKVNDGSTPFIFPE